MQSTHSLASDNDTVSMQISIDITPSTSNNADTSVDIPIGSYIPQHVLHWGGKSTNKTASRWRQSVAEQEKMRKMKKGNNPRFKTRGETWRKMVIDGNL